MPKVRRQNVPPALFQQLLERIQSRKIPAAQLALPATWLDREPDVPEARFVRDELKLTLADFIPR